MLKNCSCKVSKNPCRCVSFLLLKISLNFYSGIFSIKDSRANFCVSHIITMFFWILTQTLENPTRLNTSASWLRWSLIFALGDDWHQHVPKQRLGIFTTSKFLLPAVGHCHFFFQTNTFLLSITSVCKWLITRVHLSWISHRTSITDFYFKNSNNKTAVINSTTFTQIHLPDQLTSCVNWNTNSSSQGM